jgi:hypothetical protein
MSSDGNSSHGLLNIWCNTTLPLNTVSKFGLISSFRGVTDRKYCDDEADNGTQTCLKI